MFDLNAFSYYVNNPSAWDVYDDAMSERMRAAANEIKRLRAAMQRAADMLPANAACGVLRAALNQKD